MTRPILKLKLTPPPEFKSVLPKPKPKDKPKKHSRAHELAQEFITVTGIEPPRLLWGPAFKPLALRTRQDLAEWAETMNLSQDAQALLKRIVSARVRSKGYAIRCRDRKHRVNVLTGEQAEPVTDHDRAGWGVK